MSSLSPDVRQQNQRIAHAFDDAPYDPRADLNLDPQRLRGRAAMYGARTTGPVSVLDLGCGTGGQILRAAELVSGRVVGIDISRSATDKARARCAKFGDRVEVRCADVLDLDATALGTFDVIYLVGTLYIAPPLVARRMIELVGACLREGGVAVTSYYAGTAGAQRALIARALRNGDNPGLAVPARVSAARKRLAKLKGMFPKESSGTVGAHQLCDRLEKLGDTVFFHELLGEVFEPQSTGRLAHALAPHGVSLVDYLGPTPSVRYVDPVDRVLSVDALDLTSGGYRYAVWVKGPAKPEGPDLGATCWEVVADTKDPEDYSKPLTYTTRDKTPRTYTVSTPRAQAMLRVLADGMMPWSRLWTASTERLTARNVQIPSDEDDARVKRDFLQLYRWRVVVPVEP